MVIVQLGANRGYDGLTKWVENNKDLHIEKLILVEPMVKHHKSLEECYNQIENKIIDSVAVGLTEGEFDLYWTPKDGPLFEVTSLVKEHVIKHWGNSDIQTINVKVKTLEQILDSYNLKNIDWLLIDVEGLDAEIALTFNWHKYNIKKVDIEHLHLGNKRQNVTDLFLNMGYQPTISSDLYGYDIAFEKK
jgi:FkbM family methyltransferase